MCMTHNASVCSGEPAAICDSPMADDSLMSIGAVGHKPGEQSTARVSVCACRAYFAIATQHNTNNTNINCHDLTRTRL